MRNNRLDRLHQWMNNVKNTPNFGDVFVTPDDAKSICECIKQIADDFEDEYRVSFL